MPDPAGVAFAKTLSELSKNLVSAPAFGKLKMSTTNAEVRVLPNPTPRSLALVDCSAVAPDNSGVLLTALNTGQLLEGKPGSALPSIALKRVLALTA